MARFKDCFFGKLVSAEDRYHKQPYRDWRTDCVGQEGLIVLFESEHKDPGKVFFHMLVGVGKWMYCTVGDWEPGGEKDIILTQNSIYTFSRQHNLSKEEKRILLERAVSSGRIPDDQGLNE